MSENRNVRDPITTVAIVVGLTAVAVAVVGVVDDNPVPIITIIIGFVSACIVNLMSMSKFRGEFREGLQQVKTSTTEGLSGVKTSTDELEVKINSNMEAALERAEAAGVAKGLEQARTGEKQ